MGHVVGLVTWGNSEDSYGHILFSHAFPTNLPPYVANHRT